VSSADCDEQQEPEAHGYVEVEDERLSVTMAPSQIDPDANGVGDGSHNRRCGEPEVPGRRQHRQRVKGKHGDVMAQLEVHETDSTEEDNRQSKLETLQQSYLHLYAIWNLSRRRSFDMFT
jgi:hypothetical protein